MGDRIKEQALILETMNGLVVVTGCAHPGIVNVVRKAKALLKQDVYLALGGFHLMGMSRKQIGEIIHQLKSMGVKQVAPSHCTGDKAISLFKEAWGNNFLEGGAGAIIKLPPLHDVPK
jgi:7,8-dihydropterin-6-yl-methyl-4-(beta-D-ribofuranosyl)aminobenzene 5'-phosphate synthase